MTFDPRKLKVLLIDDEPFIRTTLSQILLNIGIKNVYQCDSVNAGLDETVRVRPDLVFCDIHMPGEDGFVYVSEVRNDAIAAVAATPVVMLTSDAAHEPVRTAKAMRVNGYLVKPVSHAAVKKAIERALKVALE